MIVTAIYQVDCEFLNEATINKNHGVTIIVECQKNEHSVGYSYYSFLNIYANGKQELNMRKINNILPLINENFKELEKDSTVYIQLKYAFIKLYKEIIENDLLTQSIKGLRPNV